VGIIVIYSTFYTYNTNISEGFSVYPSYQYSFFPTHDENRFYELGSMGSPLLFPSVHRHFSQVSRQFSESFGLKYLGNIIASSLHENDLLIVDNRLLPAYISFYLKVANPLKEYYLGNNYQTTSDYMFLQELENLEEATQKYWRVWIVTFQEIFDNQPPAFTIRDVEGRPILYLHVVG
jgi:hypothetical protein